MKKIVAGILTASLALSLAACGSNDKASSGDSKETKLVVGASNVPHAEILEKAKPILEKEGVELDIQKYQDYILPNKDLDSGDIDANYFQTIPYLDQQIKDNGYDFVSAGGIHIEPIGVYSKKYKSLKELPDGATILISSSVSDQGRILTLLESNGLITLKKGVNKSSAELKDIATNPKHLKIDDKTSAEMLVQMYNNNEGDAVVINSNFAIDGGLTPTKDAIALEDKNSSPYVNVVAVKKENKDNAAVKKLVDVLHSKEIQDFINKEWKGSVVPVSK